MYNWGRPNKADKVITGTLGDAVDTAAYTLLFLVSMITAGVCLCIGICASCCYCSVKNQIKMAHGQRVMNVQMSQMAANMGQMQQQQPGKLQ